MTPEQADASVPQSLWIGDGWVSWCSGRCTHSGGIEAYGRAVRSVGGGNTTEKTFEEVDPT